jgi:hypothetical protein
MAKDVTRDDVKPDVVHTIAVISGYPDGKVTEPSSLADDLGMSSDLRGALAPSFRSTAQHYNENAVITKAECKLLKTAKAAIDLVFQRAKTPALKAPVKVVRQ